MDNWFSNIINLHNYTDGKRLHEMLVCLHGHRRNRCARNNIIRGSKFGSFQVVSSLTEYKPNPIEPVGHLTMDSTS